MKKNLKDLKDISLSKKNLLSCKGGNGFPPALPQLPDATAGNATLPTLPALPALPDHP